MFTPRLVRVSASSRRRAAWEGLLSCKGGWGRRMGARGGGSVERKACEGAGTSRWGAAWERLLSCTECFEKGWALGLGFSVQACYHACQ